MRLAIQLLPRIKVTSLWPKKWSALNVMLLPFTLAACQHQPMDIKHKHYRSVEIQSTPDPAYIYINGHHIGTSPLTVNVPVMHKEQTLYTAMPTIASHFRQAAMVGPAGQPDEILFYMDIPPDKTFDGLEEDKQSLPLPVNPLLLPPVLYFALDKHQLKPSHKLTLQTFVQSLLQGQVKKIRIYGHADEQHSRAYNIRLALRRAQSVADHLVLQGIDKSMIEVYGLGEVEIRGRGVNKLLFAYNRKVNFELSVK